MVGRPDRRRIIDAALVIAVCLASAWLARLVYHNYFGGHAEPPVEQLEERPAGVTR